MNRIQEQYEAAARQKQGLRDGTYADDGPRAADVLEMYPLESWRNQQWNQRTAAIRLHRWSA